ncbi:MAG: hypothetical protein OXF93_15155 [Acidobacteria bacterium]|nr:hypothetical protein [Acidobacteriota bacterium]
MLRPEWRSVTENRIRDDLRRATRRRHAVAPEQPVRASEDGTPQRRRLVDDVGRSPEPRHGNAVVLLDPASVLVPLAELRLRRSISRLGQFA